MGRRSIVATTVAAGLLAMRRWQLHWGADRLEVAAVLPGDELVPAPDLVATRAITIDARATEVWPWIVQLGQNRGGFYSYDALENLVGCRIHSVDRIVPRWQDVTVGDAVHLAPEVSLTVAMADPPRAFVLSGGVPMGGGGASPYAFSWAFVVDEHVATTRLLVRERYRYTRWWAMPLVSLVQPVSFVMHQKMLRGIRDRAEGAVPWGDAPVAPTPTATAGQAPTASRRIAARSLGIGRRPATYLERIDSMLYSRIVR